MLEKREISFSWATKTVAPQKRRKTIMDALKDVFTSRPELTIRLTKSRATDLQLLRSIFIEIEKLEYIAFNSNSAAYLYNICSSLFEVSSAEFNVVYSLVGRLLDDDSGRWEIVEETNQILRGDYLLHEMAMNIKKPLLFSDGLQDLDVFDLAFIH